MGARSQGHARLPMKHARLALSAFVAVLVITAFAVGNASGEALGSSWTSSTGYSEPGIELQSCVTSVDFSRVYCVGGFDGTTYTNNVQYAPLSSSSGVGAWATAAGYPFSASGESCVALAGYIYCIGGYNGGSRTTGVYYAQPSLTGLGPWTAAPSYPLDVELQSCVASGQGIYCVGGYTHSVQVNVTYSTQYVNQTYFAALSAPSGLSSWSRSTAYPKTIEGESCVTYSGYIYCVGGYSGSTGTNSIYYSTLSSSGIGPWNSTTPYPIAVYGESCAVQYDYVYCVGGYGKSGYSAGAYYASLSSSGVGTWVQTTSYPVDVVSESCTTFYASVDCIGGFDGSAVTSATYSNSIAPLTPATVTATTAVTSFGTETKTSTTTLHTTATVSITHTSTSVVKTVSSVTSTKTITTTRISTTSVNSTGTSGSVRTADQAQPQAQSGLAGSLLQVEQPALGAAVGVVFTIAALRLNRRRKNSAPVVEP